MSRIYEFQVGKWVRENPSLLRTKETLLRKCLFLIGDENLSVGKAAIDMALKLASSPPGMQILQSEPAVLTMKEVMEKNDSVRYRVYEVNYILMSYRNFFQGFFF